MTDTNPQKIEELLTRGVEEIINREDLEKQLLSGKVLRVKLGIDPTSPNLHLGRSIPLLKLRDFQELGHKIVLIIGDFTGIIGDTSDKDSERPMLDEKIVKNNLKTYVAQAGKILDIKKCEIHYNSKWLRKLGYAEIGRQADCFSLHEFEARENIAKRMAEGKRVSLREILYPLMQGYDSVAIKADVEIGGTDQRFNLLAGRELQKSYGQKQQNIITNPLIEGLDGRKMSSSWGNTVNLLDSPSEMFGKIMSLKDEFIIKYFILATRVEMEQVKEHEKNLASGANPRDIKAKLAEEIVKLYYDEKEARKAGEEFDKVFRSGVLPSDIPVLPTERKEYFLLDLLCDTKLTPSKNEAKRLVEAGAVDIDGATLKDWKKPVEIRDGMIIKVGSRKFAKILLK